MRTLPNNPGILAGADLPLLEGLRALVYEAADWQWSDARTLEQRWRFTLGPHQFSPRSVYHFPADVAYREAPFWGRLTFLTGLVEAISYWKCACPQGLEVRCGHLRDAEKQWWQSLFLDGLGEFYHRNGLSPDGSAFLSIEADSPSEAQAPEAPIAPALWATGFSSGAMGSVLVPVGGGKDSAVSLGIIRDCGVRTVPFLINPGPASERCVSAMLGPDAPCVRLERQIDPHLLELNAQGFLNGHTPFSALVAFASLTAARGVDAASVALSNEASADEPTVGAVNHQYSKSLAFESAFRVYVREHISGVANYFSLLRPLDELQIAAILARTPEVHAAVVSCNRHIQEGTWCGACAKCLSSAILLRPYLGDSWYAWAFPRDPLDDASLDEDFAGLVGWKAQKPWECVASRADIQRALSQILHAWHPEQPLPRHLAHWQAEGSPPPEVSPWNAAHFLPGFWDSAVHAALAETDHHPLAALRAYFSGKTVGLLGMGREGRSSLNWLYNCGVTETLVAVDSHESASARHHAETVGALYVSGSDYLKALAECNIVLRSPGVRPEVVAQLPSHIEVTSQTDLVLRFAPSQTLAVTGTKGKSTTVTALAEAVRSTGRNAWLTGNIGTPHFDVIDRVGPMDLWIMELSALQLWDIRQGPRYAGILNLFPEHLDYFGSFSAYAQAKARLIGRQAPGSFYTCGKQAQLELQPYLEAAVSSPLPPAGLQGTEHAGAPALQPNLGVWFTLLEAVGVDYGTSLEVAAHFRGLSHRLERIGPVAGVTYYNDSLATVPEATLQALNHLPRIDHLILGGLDRGQDFSLLAQALVTRSEFCCWLIGTVAARLENTLHAAGVKNIQRAGTLDAVFERMRQKLEPGACVVLSPAAASYDQFHDYADRGEQFRRLAEQSGKSSKIG